MADQNTQRAERLEDCAVASRPIFVPLDFVRGSGATTIYYSAATCWWTHRAGDLGQLPGGGLPCDARGGVLMQTDDVAGFLGAAAANPDAYGRHGLQAFELAHHNNVLIKRYPTSGDWYPWCFRTWDAYNDLLDAPRVLDYRGMHL